MFVKDYDKDHVHSISKVPSHFLDVIFKVNFFPPQDILCKKEIELSLVTIAINLDNAIVFD